MKPIKFPEANTVYGDEQPEYQSLPAHRLNHDVDPAGKVTTCWRLTLVERLRVLFTGRVWHQSLTFTGPLQPLNIRADSPFKRRKT